MLFECNVPTDGMVAFLQAFPAASRPICTRLLLDSPAANGICDTPWSMKMTSTPFGDSDWGSRPVIPKLACPIEPIDTTTEQSSAFDRRGL